MNRAFVTSPQAGTAPGFAVAPSLSHRPPLVSSTQARPLSTQFAPCRTRRCAAPRMGMQVPDEVVQVVENELDLGKVTAATRAGSSGWAVMHRVTTDKGLRLFVKVSREHVSMFEGEGTGLSAMFDTQTVRIPEVYHVGSLSSTTAGSFIVMEALDLRPVFDYGTLGRLLAEMHLAQPSMAEARAGQFGFDVDNTIGATPQPNGWMPDWIEFFRERRLRHQALLTNDSAVIDKTTRLCAKLGRLFEDVKGEVRPSLVHGDLWSGNVSGMDGVPVMFDPACYYGHHEAEFGMSWCMDLPPAFWTEYRKLIPKAPGFDRRLKLYQLYHYLNHYNLFGGGYYGMADSLLTSLVSYVEE